MPEPTDEILPSLEPEEETVEEVAAEPQEQGIAPQFFGALLGGVAGSFFSRKPTRPEDDKHFREVVEKRVGLWQKSHPDAFSANIFTKSRRSGQLVINPEIERFIPNLKSLALQDFQILYPKDAKRYQELEAKRIYSDPQNDPELQKVEAGLDAEVTKAFWSPQQRTASGQQETNEETKNKIRTQRYRELIRKHPEKARYYARQNPLLKKAYEEHLEAEWMKKGRSGRLLTRLYSPDMIPQSQKNAWMPKWMRSRYERYTVRKNALSERVSKKYQSSFLGRGINRFNTGFEKTVNTALRPADYVDRKTEQALNYGVNKAFSPFKGAGAKLRGFFKKAFSSFAKRMPTIAGLALRGALAAKQVLGAALREGVGGIVRLGGSLLKSGTRYAMRVSARLAAGAAAATMPVWGPYAIGAGVVGFIILLIIIVLIATLQSTLAGEVNVDIQKSGPVQINNPVFGQDTYLEYTITVSYSGPVSSITVTDYLPEELEYVPGVSVDAPVQPTVNGNTITWVVPISGSTSTGATGPSNLDTFNQAYFSGLGFPSPNGDVTLSQEGLRRWDEGAGAAILKAAGIIGIDPGLIGAWSFFEGINYDPAVDNCDDGRNGEDTNALTRCSNTSNWQVGGVGIRPSEQLGVLAEAFEQMYGSSDASTVQRVGQEIYTKIGRSGTFPSISAAEAASRFASNPDLAGDLMRDNQIGAYILAKLFKSYGNNVANTMEGWSSTYYNRQKYINWVNALYEAR